MKLRKRGFETKLDERFKIHIESFIGHAEDIFPDFDFRGVEFVQFKSKVKGGHACYNLRVVAINDKLKLPKSIFFLLAHELAHLITWEIYGIKGHNKTFYYVVRKLGGTPTRNYKRGEYPELDIKIWDVDDIDFSTEEIRNCFNGGLITE